MKLNFQKQTILEFCRYVAGCACGLSIKLLLTYLFDLCEMEIWLGYLITHCILILSAFFFHYLITFQKKFEGFKKTVHDFLHFAATVIFFKVLDYLIVVVIVSRFEQMLFGDGSPVWQQRLFHSGVIIISSGILFFLRYFCYRFLFHGKKGSRKEKTENMEKTEKPRS